MGFVNSLIPISLLEAVILGQISCQSSDTNLLKIQIPTSDSIVGDEVNVVCMLFNPSDLEFDNIELRKCKITIREYRNLLHRMIKKEKYWRIKNFSYELRQKWLKSPIEDQISENEEIK